MIILMDMDGVIADFVTRSIEVAKLPVTFDCISEWDYFDKYMSREEFWSKIDNHEGFWENLDPHPWAHELVSMCKNYGQVIYASSPVIHHNCCEGKIKWLRKHRFMSNSQNEFMFGPEKWLLARRGRILIDDYNENIKNFIFAGGHGYTFPQNWNSGKIYIDRVTDIQNVLEDMKCLAKSSQNKKKLKLKLN